MPWKTMTRLNQRMQFVTSVLAGSATISGLCKDFGISRVCGYKWVKRFKKHGLPGLEEQSRRPRSCPDGTSGATVAQIVRIRQSHPKWGGRKIRSYLLNHNSPAPSSRTVDRILQRCGMIMVQKRRTRRVTVQVV